VQSLETRKFIDDKSVTRTKSGFSLIEVTLALGIAAFCLLAIFGLLPIGLKTQQLAVEQTAATRIASAVIADLRATSNATSTSSLFAISIPNNATASVETIFFDTDGHFSSPPVQLNSRYRVTITFSPNNSGARSATLAHLRITWPAAAAIADAGGSSETFIALDRN
jgi:uncharacterized protein (TIGR02598 family)